MVTIYAPVKATIGMPGNNGKTASKTVMLSDGFKANAETIADAVKITASIVDTFAKGYHIGTITEDTDGNIHINAIKTE